MNTFKSFCMLLVLVGVGYGVYRSMHLKNPVAPPQGVDTSIPEIDLQIGATGGDPGVAPRFSESSTGPTTLPAREGRRDNLIGRPFDFGSTSARDPKPEATNPPSVTPPTMPAGSLLPPPTQYGSSDPAVSAPPAVTPLSPLPNAPPTTLLSEGTPAKPDPAMNMVAGGSMIPSVPSDIKPVTNLQPEPGYTTPNATPAPKSNNAALSPFAPVMKETQKLIDDRKLAEALQRLTRIYDDESMSDVERAQTLDLLNQLAGTVIYSREHWLGEPRKIGAGETLEAIAKEQHVPWEMLAKVNGLVDPKQLPANELIKVVPGPFRAEISLDSKKLTLYLKDMYAGSFDIVNLGRESQYGESDYMVQKRSLNPIYDNSNQGQRFAEGDPQNPLGNFAVMLADGLVIHGHGAQVAPNDPRGSLRLSARDSEDVHDILGEGSKVTIKR